MSLIKYPRFLFVTFLVSLFYSVAVAQDNPPKLQEILKKSRESIKNKKYLYAMYYADSAIKLYSNNISAIIQRATVFYEMKEYEKAFSEFKRANDVCNKCGDPFISLAWLEYKHDKFQEAYKLIDVLLEKYPNDLYAANLYANRGQMKMNQAEYDAAYIDYCKAYDLNPDALFYLSRMILHEIHIPNDSLLVKRHLAKFKIYKNDDNASILYSNRGFIYSLMKRYTEALKDYEMAYTLNPKLVGPLVDGAIMKLYLNRPDEAKKDIEKAFSICPNSAGVWNNSGFIKLYQKKFDEAMIDLEKSIQKDSTANPEAYNNRGYIYYKKGGVENYKKALADYDKAIAVGSKIYNPYWKYRDSVVALMKQ